jgi:hypothetical protein
MILGLFFICLYQYIQDDITADKSKIIKKSNHNSQNDIKLILRFILMILIRLVDIDKYIIDK